MADLRLSTAANDPAEVWRLAYQRVLNEAGRARLHDIRAVLNSVSVSAEVLHLTSVSADATTPPMGSQMLHTIRHDLAAASAELSGLEVLVTRTHPLGIRWPQAVEWAFSVTEPVARRRQVALVAPTAVPPIPADHGAGLSVALVLIEAVCAGASGSRCETHVMTDPPRLVFEWRTPDDPGSDTLAPRLLEAVFGPRARWSRQDDHHRLEVVLAVDR